MSALALSIDGKDTVCMACAEQEANNTGHAVFFWWANKLTYCSEFDLCPICKESMNSEKAHDAAHRVAILLYGDEQ